MTEHDSSESLATRDGIAPRARWFEHRPRLIASLIGLVLVVACSTTRVDPVAWVTRLMFLGDSTVTELAGPPRIGDPLTLLFVGSDDRASAPVEGRFGYLTGERADVIAVVSIDRGQVAVLSIPRELRVTRAGMGTLAIASILERGGPADLVRAVRDVTGIRIHHYVELDFGGVVAAADAVGGVPLTLSYPIRDEKVGLQLEAGEHRLDGATTLSFLRSRTPETLRDGAWQPVPGGDLARISRQRELFAGLLTRSLEQGDVPWRTWLSIAKSETQTDPTFNAWTAAWLGWRLDRVGEGDIAWLVLPVRPERSTAELISPFDPPHIGGRAWYDVDETTVEEVLRWFELNPRAGN